MPPLKSNWVQPALKNPSSFDNSKYDINAIIAENQASAERGRQFQRDMAIRARDQLAQRQSQQQSQQIQPTKQQMGYDPQEAARRAEEQRIAEEERQKAGLRSGISTLIDQALGVYDTLFGNVRSAAKSQREALDKRQAEEAQGLTEQFNVELPKVGASYAARGLGDSTYRTAAEYQAGEGFKKQLQDVAQTTEAEKAKIGQALAAQEAEIGVGRNLLGLTRGQLGQVTDMGELMRTQADIQKRIAELQGTATSTGTREAYLQKFGELAPAANRLANLRGVLSNVIMGQAAPALKRDVAAQIIGSAGLTEEEKAQLNAEVTQQIG